MTALDKKINQLAARHRWNVTPVHDRFINRCRSLGLTTDENKKYVIDEKTAPTVRFIFEHYAAGESSASIVEQLNAKGLRTSQGNPFNKCSIPVSSRMKCTAVSIPARRTTCGSRARSPLSLMMIYGRGRKL